MKKYLTITVDGKEYPCRPTMGAMLRFKQETGREVTQIEPGDLSGLVTYLWCCARSACKREGTDFPLSLMDFADAIAPQDVALWAASLQEGGDGGEASGDAKKRSDATGHPLPAGARPGLHGPPARGLLRPDTRGVRRRLQGLRRRAGTGRAPQLGEDAPLGGGLHTAPRQEARHPAATHPPAMGQARTEGENRDTLRRASPAEAGRENEKKMIRLISTRTYLQNPGRLISPFCIYARKYNIQTRAKE